MAQMTFFKWAIDCNVLKYAQKHKNKLRKTWTTIERFQITVEKVKEGKDFNINFNVVFLAIFFYIKVYKC